MSKEIIIEEFYNKELKNEIGIELTEKEDKLALKVLKAISYTLWADEKVSKEVLEEFLHGYNKDNLINMLKNTINTVRENYSDKVIYTRDFTDVPKHLLFYNLEAEHYDNNDKLKTSLETTNLFSTRDVKIGTQIGAVNSDGALELSHYEESIFDEEGCYIFLTSKKTINLTKNIETEHIFLDYYLGNSDFN